MLNSYVNPLFLQPIANLMHLLFNSYYLFLDDHTE